ncbi:hypothetical protein ACIQFU_03350 [Streptomyces sp. NPDC093065]|uniref:hypothetical protein n=1 Tax=Streptomyces sp. NPDC093065 TaxID=3366021 RepID=UPI0038293931
MNPETWPGLPPDPRALSWYDRAALLTARAAALEVLAPRSMALRNMLWTWPATAVVAGGWCLAWVGLGGYLDLDDPGEADLFVAAALAIVSLLAAATAAVAFGRVARRGRSTQRLLEAWTALDRLPPARALPPGAIPQSLATTWDLMRAGQPWKHTVPVDGRRYLVFLSGKSLLWMTVPVAPLMAGIVLALVALTGDLGQENGVAYAQVAVAGAGAAIAALGLWGVGKGLRHYTWALREARARISEERTWPAFCPTGSSH